MASINTIYSGERLTFMNFFDKKEYSIEIPIIQRDYAQGRKTSGEIREVFLDTLFTYLDEGKPNRDLDFVYGSLFRNEEGYGKFIPLDGQQRLTTLFLLHWYLAALSGSSQHLREVIYHNDHSKFGYETRTSSREFCDALVKNDIDMGSLLSADEGKNNRLSKTIRDRGWYYMSWEYDPTIRSMMTMLDAIHHRFGSRPDFYDKLTSETEPVITLLSLDLKEFKLTDDLYIKMNSRGKPLTPFENFKAKFEQHIGRQENDGTRTYELIHEGASRTVSGQEYFSHRIDTAWADLFWNYRDKSSAYSSFDSQLMNFIRVIISSRYALEKSANKDLKLEYLFGTSVVNKRPDYNDTFSYHKYQSFKVLTPSVVNFMLDAFDSLTNGTKTIRVHLTDQSYFDEKLVFDKVLDHSINQEQRVLFYAYISYLVKNGENISGLYQWMRVIHNLSLNTVIDSADDVANAISSIEMLLAGSADILSFLTETKAIDIEFFYRRQIQEEQLKARLLSKSERWKVAIEASEKHEYFLGQIMFLFEFAGILDWYETKHHTDWDEATDDLYFKAFENYARKAAPVFDIVGTAKNKGFGWERSVLTKGDYLTRASAWRRNFLSSNRFHRDYSWKRLLRLPPNFGLSNEESISLEKRRSFVKAVFDDPLFNPENLEGSFSSICKISPDDWRKYFVRKPALIGYCGQGFIRHEPSPERIHLFKHSQQNHTQVELMTYDLYIRKMKDKGLTYPFEKWDYHEVRTGDDRAGIKFENYLLKAKTYGMAVYYDPISQEFEIDFYKTKGDRKAANFDSRIVSRLEELEFGWMDEEYGYARLVKGTQTTFDMIDQICNFLTGLKDS